MSYDIALYDKIFLKRAIKEKLGDWTGSDPIPESTLHNIREALIKSGYTLEFEGDDYQEYEKKMSGCPVEVSVFKNEIAYTIPYWENAEEAVAAAIIEAKNLAKMNDLGYFDGQEDEAVY